MATSPFDLRQDADYGDMFIPSEGQCRQAFEQAHEFVQHIREYYDDLPAEPH